MKYELHEVRCPNKTWKGNTNGKHCNALLGRVSAVSMGEFWCRKCKIVFNFVINEDGDVNYFDYTEKTPEERLLDLVNSQ